MEDVLAISGRGTVITGRVQRGVLRPGAEVEILGAGVETRRVVVTSIEAFHEMKDEARAGDNVGLLLRGVRREEVERGQVLTAPGAIQPRTEAEAELLTLTPTEGGRHTPFGPGYMPQFFFGGTDVTGTIVLVDGREEVQVTPGDRVHIRFRLQRPVGMEPGVRFAVREGGKTIGAGIVTAVV